MPAMADDHSNNNANGAQPRTKLFAADPIDLRVAARLSARRRALGLSPALLDMILGLRDGTIERLESGESRISASHLFHLAHVFEVNIDWFFAEPEASGTGDVAQQQQQQQQQEPSEAMEARRFLNFFSRLSNPAVSRQVRDIVKAIAESDRWSNEIVSMPTDGAAPTPQD